MQKIKVLVRAAADPDRRARFLVVVAVVAVAGVAGVAVAAGAGNR